MLDTNATLTGISYPIATNDSNANVTKFFCNEFAKAIIKGAQENMKDSGIDMSNIIKSKKEKENNDNVAE